MLEITNIKKVYNTAGFTQVALDNVSVAFRENEFAAILGPSGSGKTTLLNIIGGLDHYDSGDLVIDGVSTKQYKDRDWDTYRNNRIGFVFQSYNLIPHQTILANVELALTLSGVSKQERKQRAIEALDEVGLKDHIYKKPNQLSGGQMQRVAIARALINDPAILLADEPTGALDSKTSVQVMDMLTRIADKRLVVMVTHNNELALEYANRIITLKDGHIIDDTRPYQDDHLPRKTQKIRKASMSYLTALSLSFSNLMTKKGRTFVTSLAGSIGIIGIALILALANGINDYIGDIQRDTLSIYPLSISQTGMDLTSTMNDSSNTKSDEGGDVKEASMLQRMFKSQSKNDLKSLKEYIDKNDKKLAKKVNTIEYKYDVTPQIYLGDTSKSVDRVNPDALLEEYGMGSSSTMSSMASSLGVSAGMTGFQELPGEESLYASQYKVLSGHWPKNYNEAVLVLNSNGRISDFQLYEMGLKDRSELKSILDSMANNKGSDDTTISSQNLSYEQLMNTSLKVVKSVDQYQYNQDLQLWVDKSSDDAYMKPIVEKGIDLKIVGIVKPDSSETVTSLSSGVYYTPQLVSHLINETKDAQIIKEQQASPDKNVLTNRSFKDDNQSQKGFDFSSIMSIDSEKIKSAFQFDTSKIKVDTSSLNLSGVTNIAPPTIDISALTQTLSSQIHIPTNDITRVVSTVMIDFMQEEVANGVTNPTQIQTDLTAYLARSDVQANVQSQFSTLINVPQLQNQINQSLQTYMQTVMQSYAQQLSSSIQQAIQSYSKNAMLSLQKQIPEAINIDQSKFAEAFQLNMSQEELASLMTSMMSTKEVSYDNNMKTFGYASLDTPSQINIYPLSFNDKEYITDFMTTYNNKMKKEGHDDQVIQYTDLVGTMMSSVTDIVNMVSYALIAFVAISLVVSSIMIGVITYISVLERKKEIGILRAIGASKRNIRQVFNAETIIIGLLAGCLGIASALVLSSIANVFVAKAFDVNNIAQLPVTAAIVLIGISVLLTYIAGLFPAASAARKDPVEALRSE